ncbi:MAG: putative integral rane proteinase [Rickettsiales bacterium]|nr:putative integral rane proteinase [Rickettsiales bacterium]
MSWDNNKGPWGRKPTSQGKPTGNSGQRNTEEGIDNVIKRSQEQFRRFVGTGGGGSKGGRADTPNPRKLFTFVATLLALLWLSTGFYVVDTEEQAVILQFGKYNRTTNPGLNYHFPAPIEKAIKIAVTRIHQEEIGGRGTTTPAASSFGFKKDTAGYASSALKERLMLTGDSNIVDVNFVVQWRVSNAQNYIFNVRDNYGESSVKNAAESAIREVIGKTRLEAVLAKERSRIEEESKHITQSILDSYYAGIEIVRVQMLGSDPPEDVLDAFRSVEAARAEKETKKNEAERERNSIIPDARGRAQQLIEEALAYKQQTIARATGEADRFNSVYNQYKNAKDVTTERMYLETMEEILKDIPKVVLDSKGTQGVLPYLPLKELGKTSPAKSKE